MHSCTLPHCALLFLTLTFNTVPTLAFTPVTVRLNQTATLPCEHDCPGLAKWTLFDSRDALAQCNETSCWSVQGYEMSQSQYIKGDLSLIIPAADYSKRNLYTCVCDGTDIRDVRLSIETLTSSVELNLGKDLVMDLPVADPVEVVYKPKDSADFYGEQICTVTQRSLKCKSEYTPRASLSSTNITLRDVQLNDSGSYSIRDTENNEVLHIYTLFVKDVLMISDVQQQSQMIKWLLPVLILVALGIISIVCFLKIQHSKRLERIKQQELQLKRERQQQELQLKRERQQQELQLNREKNLKYQKCLEKFEQWLEENNFLHRTDSVQQRAYSDTDVAQITYSKHFSFIKEYRLEKSHQYVQQMLPTPKQELHSFPRMKGRKMREESSHQYEQQMLTKPKQRASEKYYNGPSVMHEVLQEDSINEHVTEIELNTSQWVALQCSSANEVEGTTQMEEISPLFLSSTRLEH